MSPTETHQAPAFSSTLVSRNVTVDGHRTSVRLEPEMWNGLREICRREHATMHKICSGIACRKPANTSLTAAIRVFTMAYFRAAATEDGHDRAGHGPGGGFLTSWTKPTDRDGHESTFLRQTAVNGNVNPASRTPHQFQPER